MCRLFAVAKAPQTPEPEIGCDQETLCGLIEDREFAAQQAHHGSWCGREKYTSYQDILVYRENA